MKMLCAALGLVLLAGCAGSNTGGTTKTTSHKTFKYSTDDGSTMQSAVEIRTRSNTEGGVLIKEWIRANYPGYTIDQQELLRNEPLKKMYNMITIIDANNTAKKIYFDVTQFHRRYQDELPNEPGTARPPF
jgi:hypothetical protein